MSNLENKNKNNFLSRRFFCRRGENGWSIDCTGLHKGDGAAVACVFAAAVIYTLALVLDMPAWLSAVLLALSIIIGGGSVILQAVLSVMDKKLGEPCLLITIAGIVTFCTGSFAAGAAIFLLYRIIDLLMLDGAYRLTQAMLAKSEVKTPEEVLVRKDGEETRIPADSAAEGDTLILGSGEMAACDCVVAEGGGAVDISALTGKETPITVREGDNVPAGSVNLGDRLVCHVVEKQEDSGLAMLSQLRRSASEHPSVGGRAAAQINAFLCAVAVVALAVAIVVPIVSDAGVGQALCRACAVLALGGTGSVLVGVPTAYLAALLNAPKNGVAYRGTQCLEKLSKADTVVFEKRGTLAASELRVMAVKSDKMDADMMLKIAAHAEAYSKDPAAKSIIAAYGGVIYIELIQHYREIPGEGIAVMIQNIPIMLGSQHFLEAQGIGVSTDGGVEKAVFMAVNGQYAGRIVLGSSVKEDAVPALQMLSEVGVRRTVVTTDEGSDSASAFASAVGIRDVKSDFNPRVNAQFVGDLVSKQQGTGAVIFVAGDASQAEAMEKADVGVAMGSVNSCLSCGAADMMIFSSPTSLADEIAQARAARKRAGVSLAVPAAVKAVLAVLCAFGVIGAWIALLVDGVAAGAAAAIAARK